MLFSETTINKIDEEKKKSADKTVPRHIFFQPNKHRTLKIHLHIPTPPPPPPSPPLYTLYISVGDVTGRNTIFKTQQSITNVLCESFLLRDVNFAFRFNKQYGFDTLSDFIILCELFR